MNHLKSFLHTFTTFNFMCRSLLYYTIILLVNCFHSPAFTQPRQIQFQHLGVEDGLSDNHGNAITQDKFGYIWIGTMDGLNRFDGYHVETFSHIRNDKNSLCNNAIYCLFTDSRGMVWAGTENGLAFFNYRTNTFISFFKNENDSNSLPSNQVYTINEDQNGVLWLGTTSGLCSFDIKRNHFQRFLHYEYHNSISSNSIKDIKFAPDKTMWISTANGLNHLDLSTMHFTAFFHDGNNNLSLKGNDLGKIAIDNFGNIFTFLYNTLQLEYFNTGSNTCRHFSALIKTESNISSNYIRDILIDRNGALWVGTNHSGLCLFFPANDSFNLYEPDEIVKNSLHGASIIKIFQGRSGLIWLGTAVAGVERFNPESSKFVSYSKRSNFPTLADNWTRAVCEDTSHQLWIATAVGLSVFNDHREPSANYHWDPKDKYALSENSVRSLCCDIRGDIWVGTSNGLNLYDSKHKRFTRYFSEKNTHSIPGDFILSIISDSNNLWIATSGGLCGYNFKSNRFFNFKSDTALALLNRNIRVVYEDKKGILWAGIYPNGLVKYNPVNKQINYFSQDQTISSSIPENQILSIAEDNKNKIWMGTTNGLWCLNEKTNTFSFYSKTDGLPNEHVSQLLMDDNDCIWMSTNKGISVFNESRNAFTNYTVSDGLQGPEFNDQSAFKTHDGYFCYCGYNGFTMFYPDSVNKIVQATPPPLVLERFLVFREPLQINGSYENLKSLKLSYKQNFFSVEFAALNYDHPERNLYTCQLIGFDKKLIQLGNNHTISYTNVPAGNYTLRIFTSSNNAIWNTEGITLQLTITPPFWQTWWFYILCAITAIGLVYIIYRIRIQRILEMAAMRQRISKDLHDDIGSTLSSINIWSNVAAKHNAKDPGQSAQLLKKIQDSSQKTIGNMSDIVWAINPLNDNLSEIMIRMQQYAAEVLDPQDIHFIFSFDEKFNDVKLNLQQRRDVFLIYKESLNNLSKYAHCSEVIISFQPVKNWLRLQIKDNGSGFDKNTVRYGNGLQNMGNRAKDLKGSLTVDSTIGEGTSVTLHFKIT